MDALFFCFNYPLNDAHARRQVLSKVNCQIPDDVQLFMEYVELPNGALIFTKCFVPKNKPSKGMLCYNMGFGDTIEWVLHSLGLMWCQLGYTFFVHEYLGHGKSDGLWTYVDDYRNLVNNTIFVIKHGINKYGQNLDCFIIGESMGGAVTINIARKQPQLFKGMILVAPMCKVDDTIRPSKLVESIFRNWIICCCPKAPIAPTKRLLNYLTQSPEVMQEVLESPCLYDQRPRLKTADELLKLCDDIQTHLFEITIPFFIVHGGGDKITDPLISEALFEGAKSTDKTFKIYEGAWHMLWKEPCSEKLFQDVAEWIQQRLTGSNNLNINEKKKIIQFGSKDTEILGNGNEKDKVDLQIVDSIEYDMRNHSMLSEEETQKIYPTSITKNNRDN